MGSDGAVGPVRVQLSPQRGFSRVQDIPPLQAEETGLDESSYFGLYRTCPAASRRSRDIDRLPLYAATTPVMSFAHRSANTSRQFMTTAFPTIDRGAYWREVSGWRSSARPAVPR
jgi:hypothetical protein